MKTFVKVIEEYTDVTGRDNKVGEIIEVSNLLAYKLKKQGYVEYIEEDDILDGDTSDY
jgi:hypothetical protein